MSLSRNFWQAIETNAAEVPWLFQVSRIDGVTVDRVLLGNVTTSVAVIDEKRPDPALEAVVGGPLDFRAPANYIFLPWWMMRSLGLRPHDIVQVDLVSATPPGSLAKLRPPQLGLCAKHCQSAGRARNGTATLQ